ALLPSLDGLSIPSDQRPAAPPPLPYTTLFRSPPMTRSPTAPRRVCSPRQASRPSSADPGTSPRPTPPTSSSNSSRSPPASPSSTPSSSTCPPTDRYTPAAPRREVSRPVSFLVPSCLDGSRSSVRRNHGERILGR